MRKIIFILLLTLFLTLVSCDKTEEITEQQITIDETNYKNYFTIKTYFGDVHDSTGKKIEVGVIKDTAQFDYSVIIVPNQNVEINAIHLSLTPTFRVKYCYLDASYLRHYESKNLEYSCSPMSFNNYVKTYNFVVYCKGMYFVNSSSYNLHYVTGTVTVKS